MKWEDLRRSSNIEDLRSSTSSNRFSSGGRGNMRLLVPLIQFLLGTKIGRILLIVGVIAYFLGFNPLALLEQSTTSQQVSKPLASEQKTAEFVSVVLAQTEDVWSKLFREANTQYKEPKLVLFRGAVESGCGYASRQIGPFYCPNDKKVYLDLSFFDELKNRYGAGGDFAQAYVVAHEVGHHVQNLLGTLDKSNKSKQMATSKTKANAVQVKVELQADCYAGIWAHYLSTVLEEGDINEALNAASAIGDDTLQRQAQGRVVPDSFTHGSSSDRKEWFQRGYKSGQLGACETGL